MTKATTIGLDIAKQVFQVHGADRSGRAVLRRKLRRNEVSRFFSEQPPCLVGIEASGSAHHCARVLSGLGHTVRFDLTPRNPPRWECDSSEGNAKSARLQKLAEG